jgi:hypothetical protein
MTAATQPGGVYISREGRAVTCAVFVCQGMYPTQHLSKVQVCNLHALCWSGQYNSAMSDVQDAAAAQQQQQLAAADGSDGTVRSPVRSSQWGMFPFLKLLHPTIYCPLFAPHNPASCSRWRC